MTDAARRFALFALLIALAGCRFGYTDIGTITAAPGQFEGKEVKVQGRARGVTRVPLLELKIYTLRDKTGEIVVVTQGPQPRTDENVSLRGRVQSLAIVGGAPLGLRLTELERL